MADAGAGGDVGKAIGDPLGTLGAALAGFVPEGPLRTAVLLVYGLCVAIAPFIYKYYLGVLAQGAAPEGSIERQDYDRLRAGLAGDNLAARLYAKWLTAFLDGVERFFGDAGIEGQRAFWLKKPAPLWSAPALDRCLLLALIYPIATIFIIWAISGHVGPAEAALGLKRDADGWRRAGAAGSLALLTFVHWRLAQPPASRRGSGDIALSLALSLSLPLALALALSLALALALSLALALASYC